MTARLCFCVECDAETQQADEPICPACKRPCETYVDQAPLDKGGLHYVRTSCCGVDLASRRTEFQKWDETIYRPPQSPPPITSCRHCGYPGNAAVCNLCKRAR